MIYLVTKQKQLFENDLYKICTVIESIQYLIKLNEIYVDTETTGLDAHINDLFSVQLGDQYTQYLIDTTTVPILEYKDLLENTPLVLQNAKFDLQFFYKYGIIPSKIYDTMLVEQVLYNTYDPIDGNPVKVECSYKALAKKYCNATIDKSIRPDIWKLGLIDSVIKYSAEDIEYLPEIKLKQIRTARRFDLLEAIRLENEFVRVLAYVEWCGIYLDRDKWIKKYKSANEELRKKIALLEEYTIKNYPKYIDPQLDLFSTKQKTIINWASSKQVIPLFKDIGIDISADNVSGESISEPILKSQKHKFEIIPLFMEYQTIKKDFTTYGEKFLDNINPKTNRIHSNFNQLQITSRLSSNNPNMQNIPSDERTRSCFTAEKGNILVDADYSQQEDILFTQLSKEQKMIEFYQGDSADGHSYVAKLCFPEELKDIPEEEVKAKAPKLRFNAKSAKFSIHYGGTPHAMNRNLGIPLDEAEGIFKAYLKAFPDINKYLTRVKKEAISKGYILTSPLTKRKVWCKNFKELQETNNYKALYKFSKLACNYPIQSSGAETIKIALIYFFRRIVAEDLFDIVKISGVIHDEILCECPIELKKVVATELQKYMEKSGALFCKDVKLKAVPEISSFWTH